MKNIILLTFFGIAGFISNAQSINRGCDRPASEAFTIYIDTFSYSEMYYNGKTVLFKFHPNLTQISLLQGESHIYDDPNEIHEISFFEGDSISLTFGFGDVQEDNNFYEPLNPDTTAILEFFFDNGDTLKFEDDYVSYKFSQPGLLKIRGHILGEVNFRFISMKRPQESSSEKTIDQLIVQEINSNIILIYPSEKNSSIQLINTQGQILQSWTSVKPFKFDLESLPKGKYFILEKSEEGIRLGNCIRI